MCVPTVIKVADEETKKRFVGPAVRGEEIWCQLFSEPSSGSDLASICTRAVCDGDDWIINGQKIWTSGAHYSDFGLLLARTNPDAVKHKGLTMFWIDMHAPGVDVRPIHQMSGRSEFNEVFISDLRIRDSQRLGAVDDGWRVSLVTLMNERAAIGSFAGSALTAQAVMNVAADMRGIDGMPVLESSALRERLADWYVQAEGLRLTSLRTLTALSRGETPGPENAIAKIVMANLVQDLTSRALELQDSFAIISDPTIALAGALFQFGVLGSPALRIAGGTDEILRNLIAERVLGLPGEVRTDKAIPFKDLPRGV
jgi:alkylation response protein AidB-like acyl-CoA dehydrogenase